MLALYSKRNLTGSLCAGSKGIECYVVEYRIQYVQYVYRKYIQNYSIPYVFQLFQFLISKRQPMILVRHYSRIYFC